MSAAGGRGLFLGGISPAAMRSWIFTHMAKFSMFAGSNLSAVRSRPPFFESTSWHEVQCASKNLLGGAAEAAAGSASAARNARRVRMVGLKVGDLAERVAPSVMRNEEWV